MAYSYNAADQLTLWPGMHSYEYDDNGALTTVKTADGQAEQQTFSYHPTGLMNTATFGDQTLTNLWDADEHRLQFSVGEDDYTSVFDVTAGIPAVIKEITPQGTIYYVREPGGELIARVVGESRRYYHFDELGSTRLITDGSGAVTDRYAYDAYGAVIAHDRDAGTVHQPYQYVGQLGYYTHYDAPEFGWLQLGVRFYEPETGRFERRDDLADGTTDYQYALLNPESFVDDGGLKARRPLKKPLPRHMPQPRKLRKPSPHPVIPGKHPSMVKEFWRKLKPWARRINMCKAAVDWPCRTAVAFHVYLACGQQRDMQCFESALDDLEHGLSVVGSAGGIDRGLAWVGRQCLEQVRSEADLAGDVWGWVRKHLP